MTSREQFEAWFKHHRVYPDWATTVWKAWQARGELDAKRIAELEEQLLGKSNKAQIFTMADLSNSKPLTLTERKMLICGAMSVLLDEDDRLSNLGILLSKYEDTIREQELRVAELEKDKLGLKNQVNYRCADVQRLETKLTIAIEALDNCLGGDDYYNRPLITEALNKIKGE